MALRRVEINFGFNVSARYHNAYLWESTFLNGMIPDVWVFDAAMNFNVTELNSKIKIVIIENSNNDILKETFYSGF